MSFGKIYIAFVLCLISCGTLQKTKVSNNVKDISAIPYTLQSTSQLRLISLNEKLDAPINSIVALRPLLWDKKSNSWIAFPPTCSAVSLTPNLIITAAHCVIGLTENILYQKQYIACDQRSEFQIFGIPARIGTTLTKVVRLIFEGSVLSSNVSQGPNGFPVSDTVETCATESQSERIISSERRTVIGKPEVVAIDHDLDFAILRTPVKLGGSNIDLFSSTNVASHVGLLGFPNGLPLTLSLANGVSGAENESESANQNHFKHHCSSLQGSSGGLVFDIDSQTPIGIHVRGAGINLFHFYETHGRFESPIEALQGFCRMVGTEFPQPSGECSSALSGNISLTFQGIIQALNQSGKSVLKELQDANTN